MIGIKLNSDIRLQSDQITVNGIYMKVLVVVTVTVVTLCRRLHDVF